MHFRRDLNRERIGFPRPEERHTGTWGTGNPAQDGFDRLERRPRVAGGMADAPMSLERAERIEEFARPLPMDDY